MRFIFSFLLILMMTSSSFAEQLPTLDGVLENVKTELGGIPQIETLNSISAIAHVTVGESSYTVITENKGFEEAKFERIYPDRHLTFSFNKEGVFSENHNNNTKEKIGDGLKYFIKGHQFHWEALHIDHFENLILEGFRNFRGCECLVVSGATGNERPIEFMINPETWKIIGSTLMPEGVDYVIDFLYEDWQKIDGIQTFKTVKIYDGDNVFNYSFGHVTYK